MIHLLTFNKVFLFKIKTHILITKVKLIWLNLWPNLSTEILFILCIYAKMTYSVFKWKWIEGSKIEIHMFLLNTLTRWFIFHFITFKINKLFVFWFSKYIYSISFSEIVVSEIFLIAHFLTYSSFSGNFKYLSFRWVALKKTEKEINKSQQWIWNLKFWMSKQSG